MSTLARRVYHGGDKVQRASCHCPVQERYLSQASTPIVLHDPLLKGHLDLLLLFHRRPTCVADGNALNDAWYTHDSQPLSVGADRQTICYEWSTAGQCAGAYLYPRASSQRR